MIALGPGAEFDLVRDLVGAAPDLPGVPVGPGDDCAVLRGGLVLTCDMAVEDVHFRRAWLDPAAIGWRAAAAALSDLAAMAATPVAALVSYALPQGWAASVAPALHSGVEDACRAVGASVAGGDLTASPGPLVIDVTAVGRAGDPVLRSGARPGDELWVTGRLGGAAAAVSLLLDGKEPPQRLFEAYARPRPRTAEAAWLAAHVRLSALIDLSDGLSGDAGHMAAASAATLVIDRSAVPVAAGASEAVGGGDRALELALSGGEDYELLIAAPAGALAPLAPGFHDAFGVALTRVGRVEERSDHPVLLEAPDGSTAPPPRRGFDHFARAEP